MTIERDWLNGVIELVLGRSIEPQLLDQIAEVLETPEEVLPWLMLRQGVFAEDPDISAHLKAVAAQASQVLLQRPAGPVVCPDVVERHGLAERTLGDLVAQNIAGASFADHLGAILHRQNQACSGRPGYDFRRRIAEPLPNALTMPGPGVTG